MTRAAVLRAAGEPLEVVDLELAPTGPDQVRVRLGATGVCHSDLSIATGALAHPLPVVLGHEGAGVVSEVGSAVTSVGVGDHVVLNWTPSCGSCFFCVRGEGYLCERASTDAMSAPYATLDGAPVHCGLGTGAFAEETLVLERAVVPIESDVPFEVAALVGCAVMTGVGAVMNTAAVQAGSTVLVVGLGGVGLSVVQGARLAGATRIVGVDLSAERRALAGTLGATDVVDGGGEVEKQVRALTDGRGVDHAFEAVGRSDTIKLAYRCTRRGGTVVVVGAGRKDDPVSFSSLELFYQARRLIGCIYGSADPRRDFPMLLDRYRAGDLLLDRLITDRVDLTGIDEAFRRMAAGEGARSVVLFDQE